MAQEFTIKSPDIESKINQLLPSQGGFGAGVDFSASTMVIPIVDLTETAEGSSLRQDLQSSLSLTSVTAFSVNSTSATDVVTTTGYFRVFGSASLYINSGTATASIQVTDGTTTKVLTRFRLDSNTSGTNISQNTPFDFLVFLKAGDTLQMIVSGSDNVLDGCTRQIADINGNLINPL